MEIETRLDRRTVDALIQEVGEERFESVLRSGDRRGGEQGRNNAIVRELFFRRDAQGASFAERWLAAGAPGFTNDERVFLAGKARMRPALLEVIEVREDGLLTMVDLLDPAAEPIRVLDRSTWARAVRYEVLFVWAYPLPHYWRMSGGGVRWPEWRGLSLATPEQLREIIRHAGGPGADAPLAEQRAWLAENFEAVNEIVFLVSDVRRRDLIESIDAHWGWSDYRLDVAALKKLGRTLAGSDSRVRPAELEDEEISAGFDTAWDWCEAGESSASSRARAVVGTVLLGKGVMRLRAMGKARLARLRSEILAVLDQPDLQAEREFSQDLGRQEVLRIPETDLARVPPRLREEPDQVEFQSYALDPGEAGQSPQDVAGEQIGMMSRAWIDMPIPTLGGRTPREAVKEPEGRVMVVRLMKEHITSEDRDHLRGRRVTRSTPEMVRELGLTELEGSPPPVRPCPEEWLEEEDAGSLRELPARESAPVWTGKTLSDDEIDDRFELMNIVFPTDEELIEAWAASCPVLADMMLQELDDLPPATAEQIECAVAMVWALLGGASVPGVLAINVERVRLRFREAVHVMESEHTDVSEASVLFGLCASQQRLVFMILAVNLKRFRSPGQANGNDQIFADRALPWIHVLIGELESILT